MGNTDDDGCTYLTCSGSIIENRIGEDASEDFEVFNGFTDENDFVGG